MSIKVLGHSHAYPPTGNAGGPLTMHALLREGVRRRGWQCSVLLDSAPNGHYEWENLKVTQTRSVPTMRKIYGDADVVLTHLAATKRSMDLAGKTKPLVHLVHNHSQLFQHHVENQNNYMVIFNSIWMSKHSTWDGKSTILHPIVNPSKYRVRPNGSEVVLINRTTSKGVDLFYDLVRANPDIDFVAVRGGYGQQVSVPEEFKNLTEIDNVTDMTQVYKRARLVLMPSLYETWGRVAIEAAVSGIPTLGSETHGLLESGICAGYFPVGDFDQWNAGLRAVMGDDDLWMRSSAHASARLKVVQEITDMETEKALDMIEAMAG